MKSLLLLAVGLALDAVAVSLLQGLLAQGRDARHALRLALAFGVAQGVMPLCGFALARFFHAAIGAFDHWVASAILIALGLRMLHASRAPAPPAGESARLARGATLALLALATSVDALAAGLTLPTLAVDPWLAALVIAGVTALLSGAAALAGHALGARWGARAEGLGGVLLVALGVKVLFDHGAL